MTRLRHFEAAQKLMTWSLFAEVERWRCCLRSARNESPVVSVSRSCLRRAALPFSSGTSIFISSGETRRMADMAGDHYNKTTLLQLQTLQRKAKGVAARRECHLIRFVRECVS